MTFLGCEDGSEPRMPGHPFNLTVTRNLDLPASQCRECVLHEEILFVHDVSELALIANQLVRVHGGDGFSIRRVEEALRNVESMNGWSTPVDPVTAPSGCRIHSSCGDP